MEVILDLSDFNKKEIDQIDACKKELIDLCIKQQELYNNILKLFEKIKTINFSKRVINPCKKCIVLPACTEESIYKKKQILISTIKQDIKSPSFVSENTNQIFGRVLPVHGQNPSQLSNQYGFWKDIIFPEGWELE